MRFQIVRANAHDLPPIALKYLQTAIDSTPCNVETVESILEAVATEAGSVFLVRRDDDIYAALFTQLVPNPKADAPKANFLNIIALGAKEGTMELWRDEIWQFILEMLELTDAQLVAMTGRQWERIFPMKKVGYIYTYG